VGLAAGVVLPFLLLLLVSLVGSPLALVVVATIVGLLALAVLVTGPVPALAAVGDLLTGRRAGLFGGFLVGAGAWWLLASLVPFAGAVLGLALYTWGIGAWLTAGWRQRARALEAAPLVPLRSRKAGTAPPADWEPPLPPSPAS
jgi:hypothetical protein